MNPDPARDGADAARSARLLPLPVERELSGSRHRQLKEYLMREIAQSTPETSSTSEPSSAPEPAPPPQPSKTRRPRRRLAYFAAPIAAAGAFAVLAVSAGNGTTHGNTTQGANTHTSSTQPGSPAAQLLDRIATVAQSKPLPSVRDDQFVYVESEISSEVDIQNSSGYHSTLTPLHLRQIWTSVDDSRPGLLREEGQDTVLANPAATAPDTVVSAAPGTSAGSPAGAPPQATRVPNINSPDYRYLETLPTDPAVLLQKIYTETAGEGGSDHVGEAFTTIGDLLREQIAPPTVTAALYKAAAMIPGVRVIGDVVDKTGRHDVAVALDNSIAVNEWLFDKSSLDFVGQQTVSLKAGPLGPAGTVVNTQIILDSAIVDRAGEVPGKSAN